MIIVKEVKPKKSKANLLITNKVLVFDSDLKSQLIEKGFGEKQETGELVLDLKEALFLLEKKKIEIVDAKEARVREKELLQYAQNREKKFFTKFLVYRDLRERGLVAKTGFKFGFDFRVYPKGKKAGEAHSQFVVNAVTQDASISMPELSRMVRLSGNIRTLLLLAVVDSENDINYYSIARTTL